MFAFAKQSTTNHKPRPLTNLRMIATRKLTAMYRSLLTRTLALGVGLFLLAVTGGLAQSNDRLDETVFTVVEKQPEFPGGMRAFQDYLATNVRYPAAASTAAIKDKVFVSFIVRSNGRITDVGVLKGLGYGCDEEAVRVISAMPNWRPGSQSGKPVNVKYNVIVPFGMDDSKPKRR